MKRIFLFILTNVLVVAVLGVVASLLGVNRYLASSGLNLGALLGFALIMGFGGAIISLLISKPMAKWSLGVQVIAQPRNADEAWILETVRKLSDKAARPLIEIRKDKEEIMGKPVLISPSMPTYDASPLVAGKIVFGDLSRYVVRTSPMVIRRRTDLPGYAENGKALYTARMRADARISDPSNGVTPPIVFITVTV